MHEARQVLRHEASRSQDRGGYTPRREGSTTLGYGHDSETGTPFLQRNTSLEPRTGKGLWRLARNKAMGVVYLTRRAVDSIAEEAGGLRSPSMRVGAADGDDFIGLPSRGDIMSTSLSVPLLLPQETDFVPGNFAPLNDMKVFLSAVVNSYMSFLLLCVPLGIASGIRGWDARITFGLNFFGLVPLALLLGEVTEDLALRFGDVVGGLLNATFGNIVELILSIAALTKGLYAVVATSLIGSILSNLLLVLGCCFLFGGLKYREQTFNVVANKASCSLLFMACISIQIPTSASMLYGAKLTEADLLHISRGTCILLVITYGVYLVFQLSTHSHLFQGEESEDHPSLSLFGALGMLGGITIIVAICSEFLTGAIEEVSKTSGLSEEFLGLIVLPIAGNACEHITAVFVAVKNKMDLSLGVALGSSIQIAIFVLPVVVLVGWLPFVDRPMDLNFSPLAVQLTTLSVILAYFVSSDGRSNYLMGLQLVFVYLLIALVYFYVH